MDPLTQGALGAAFPQAIATSRKGAVVLAGLFGFLAGLLPDLDVLIKSTDDPLLFLEYHRQFTHSLVFIPVGGLIAATVLHFLVGRRWRLPFGRTLLFCTLGYSTHGLLDFMTSYGTMLFWPFTNARYAANIISIIDPLFTVPIVLLVIVAAIRRARLYARLALAWGCLYLCLGAVQHYGARQMAEDIAAARGHSIERLLVKPSFGNILVWKSVYESGDRFYVDGMRVGIAPAVYPGPSLVRLDPARDFPWLDPASQQARDIERFSWFSMGYIALNPEEPDQVIDVRYSFLPNQLEALWWIELARDAAPDRHVRFVTNNGDTRADFITLWRLMTAE